MPTFAAQAHADLSKVSRRWDAVADEGDAAPSPTWGSASGGCSPEAAIPPWSVTLSTARIDLAAAEEQLQQSRRSLEPEQNHVAR
jgi:hypothetical protein